MIETFVKVVDGMDNSELMRHAVSLCFLLLTAMCLAAEPDHVTIDPKRNWEPIVFLVDPAHPPADVVSIDLKGELAKFCSYDANLLGTFEYRLHIPTSGENYPIFVLRYRATNLDTTSEEPGLWIDISPDGRMRFRPVAKLKEFIADGREHELRIDLRDKEIKSVFLRFMIC